MNAVVVTSGHPRRCKHLPDPESSEPQPRCDIAESASGWIFRTEVTTSQYRWCKRCESIKDGDPGSWRSTGGEQRPCPYCGEPCYSYAEHLRHGGCEVVL